MSHIDDDKYQELLDSAIPAGHINDMMYDALNTTKHIDDGQMDALVTDLGHTGHIDDLFDAG